MNKLKGKSKTTRKAPAKTPVKTASKIKQTTKRAAEKVLPQSQFQVKRLNLSAKSPTRGSKFAAGYDLYSCEETIIPKRGRGLVSTGIAIKVPKSTYGRVAPRSGLTVKNGIDTGAGVIDEDYRGEVKVVLFNHTDEDFVVSPGDRVAQLVLEQILTPEVFEVDELEESTRGENGFGSTGTN